MKLRVTLNVDRIEIIGHGGLDSEALTTRKMLNRIRKDFDPGDNVVVRLWLGKGTPNSVEPLVTGLRVERIIRMLESYA